MGSHMGSPDDEMNRREELRERHRKEMSGEKTVGGSDPDSGGKLSTTDGSSQEMMEKFNEVRKEVEMKTETRKVKSPRYGEVPKYKLEELDADKLRTEVFHLLDFSKSEKQAAGVLVEYAGEDMTYEELGEKAGVSGSTIGRVKRSIVTSTDPLEHYVDILRFARENPDLLIGEIADEFEKSATNVKTILREFRHREIECEVEVPAHTDENEETRGEKDVDEVQDETGEDDTEQETREDDAVQRDLDGDEDVQYKYDPKDKAKKQTRGGQSLKKIKDKDHLISLFREMDRRIRELENSGVDVDIPDSVKGRIASLEGQIDGIQSVVDRIENQQANLDRFVEEELNTSSDLANIEDDVEELKKQCQGITDAADLEWSDTELGKRIERIEDSLASHKEAIEATEEHVDELEQGEGVSTNFTTEDKRKIIIALAENDNEELIDRVLDEF